MQFFPSAFAQLRSSRSMIALILIVSAFLIGIIVLLSLLEGIPISKLTQDPTAIVGAPIYTGFLSQIGIFFWSGSAAICMFSAKVIPRDSGNVMVKRFFFVSGLLTLLLGFDDVFLLHEAFFPYIGFPEKALIVSYAGLILLYLALFFSIILKTEYVLLGMSLFFFGISIALDLINPRGIDPFLFEDGAKLVGIVSWLTYFYRSAVSTVCQNVAQQGTAPDDNSAALHCRR